MSVINECISDLKATYKELYIYKHYNAMLLGYQEQQAEIDEVLKDFNIKMYVGVDKDANLPLKVIDWDRIVEEKIELILVVLPLVYSRKLAIEIGSFCECFNLIFVDQHNNDLCELYRTEKEYERQYEQKSLEDLKEKIDAHEVISFDIFDTLLCRRILNPEDVYEAVALKCDLEIDDFKIQRLEACSEQENPNIYDIYNKLQNKNGWSDKVKERIMKCEIQTECDVLVPRKRVCDAFYYALEQKKEIFILSDMYMPKEVLNKILKKKGIQGYKELWVSCEKKKTKYCGLFEELKEVIGQKTCLHVGDNWSVDGICAQIAGIDTYLIKSVNDLLKKSIYARCESLCRTINDSILAGMVVERLFNNPFIYHDFMDGNTTFKDIGYTHIGPAISAFMCWLLKELEKSKYDKVIFPSRDGYLIEKLYKFYSGNKVEKDFPEGIYIETSRNACMVANVRRKRDVREMLKSCPYQNVAEVLEKRFLVLPDEEMILNDSDVKLVDAVWMQKDKITKKSKQICAAYRKFLKKRKIEKEKKYAFFDLVSSGTCQLHMTSILNSRLTGYYFYQNEPDSVQKQQLHIESFGNYKYVDDKNSAVRRKYLLLEFVLSSDKPSVKYVNEDGNVLYEQEKRKKKEIQMMLQMQKGIQEFFSAYTEIACKENEISKQLADYFFACIDKKENLINNHDFDNIRIYDDWSDVYINCVNRN